MKLNHLILILIVSGYINSVSAQWSMKHIDKSCNCLVNVIKFNNNSIGLLMGDNSNILKSSNNGDTWNIVNNKTQINIADFQFVQDSIVYAVGSVRSDQGSISKIIKSIDSGDSWDSIVSIKGKQLYSIWFFDNDSGLVAGYDGIYRTTDFGKNWDTVWSITKFGYEFGDVKQLCFPTMQIGYAIGRGIFPNDNPKFLDNFLLKTYNSGLKWDTIITLPNYLKSIYFLNKDTGYIGTESYGTIIKKTVDGGVTWNDVQISDNVNSVNSISFISNMIGFATGTPSAMYPEELPTFFISKTLNGGDTWEIYDTIGIPLNSIYFINENLGFVSGFCDLIMKSNGKINKLPIDYPWDIIVEDNLIEGYKKDDIQIKTYPNPTSGLITIQLSNSNKIINSISLVSLYGQVIDSKKILDNRDIIQFDLSTLSSGMYLLKIAYLDKIKLFKVLKNK